MCRVAPLYIYITPINYCNDEYYNRIPLYKHWDIFYEQRLPAIYRPLCRDNNSAQKQNGLTNIATTHRLLLARPIELPFQYVTCNTTQLILNQSHNTTKKTTLRITPRSLALFCPMHVAKSA